MACGEKRTALRVPASPTPTSRTRSNPSSIPASLAATRTATLRAAASSSGAASAFSTASTTPGITLLRTLVVSLAGLSPGVSEVPDEHRANLADMREHEMHLVRWWIFPDFRGDGVVFDESGHPVGIGGTLQADLEKALEPAARADVYLMLTLFSFDGFRPDRSVSGRWVPSLESHRHRRGASGRADRERGEAGRSRSRTRALTLTGLLSWDVINEPEWSPQRQRSLRGSSLFPDRRAFDGDALRDGGSFLHEVIAVLPRGERGARHGRLGGPPVGQSLVRARSRLLPSAPLRRARLRLDVDTRRPRARQAHDARRVPAHGLSRKPYGEAVDDWWTYGWAGAMAWQYNASDSAHRDAIAEFGAAHECAGRSRARAEPDFLILGASA